MLRAIKDKEETAKLRRMGMEGEPVTLQLKSENLLQLDSTVKFDEDILEAQDWLETQFPGDFPKDPVPKGPTPPPPTAEELEQQKQKEFLRFAEKVTEEATESRDRVVREIEEESERKALARMGIEDEPVKKERDWKDQEASRKQLLLQIGSNVVVDQAQVDENVEIAQAYLEERFPDDFPKPAPPPKPVPKGPSPEEIAEKERKELIQYSARVADEAKSYQQELKNKEAEQKEAKALSKMGYDEKFKPEYAPKAAPLPMEVQLLQLSADIKTDDSAFDPDA